MALTTYQQKRLEIIAHYAAKVVEKNVNNNPKFAKYAKMYSFVNNYRFEIRSNDEVASDVGQPKSLIWGYCDYSNAVIVLNEDHALYGDLDDVCDTILHECAHAIAYVEHGDFKHGKGFRVIARRFGCNPRARSKTKLPPEIERKQREIKKYSLLHIDHQKETVRAIGTCDRKLKNLHTRWVVGKPETKGEVYLVENSKVDLDRDGYDIVCKVAFQ